jgi:hypothetical protein
MSAFVLSSVEPRVTKVGSVGKARARKGRGMKQKVALLLVGILVGSLIMMVLPVEAHHGRDVRRLRRKVAALRNRVGGLEFAVFDCLFVQGISSFGDPDSETGYLFDDGTGTTFLTTANDFDDSNGPHIFAMAADPACVTSSTRSTDERPFKQASVGAQNSKRSKR